MGKDVSTILQTMPKNDRKRLEFFFRELIEKESFGYVFLGNKPVSISVITRKINPFKGIFGETQKTQYSPKKIEKFYWNLRNLFSFHRYKINKGFETWRRYEKFFPISRFLLSYETSQDQIGEYVNVIGINKECFINTANRHKNDFRSLLNKDEDVINLLNEIQNKPLISGVLSNHDGLIGTMLGYGRENSFLFYKKYRNNMDDEKVQLGFVWDNIDYPNLNHIPLPGFRADPLSLETKALCKEYLATRDRIIEYYKEKDFLEATLNLLISDSDIISR